MKCTGIVGNSWAGRLIFCLHVSDCEIHSKSDAQKVGVSGLDVRSVPVTKGVRQSGENRCGRAVQQVARWFMSCAFASACRRTTHPTSSTLLRSCNRSTASGAPSSYHYWDSGESSKLVPTASLRAYRTSLLSCLGCC
jgi:hypothetical protein